VITAILWIGLILTVWLVISSWFMANAGRHVSAASRALAGAVIGVATCAAVFYLHSKGMI
jgi:hypothetical protein